MIGRAVFDRSGRELAIRDIGRKTWIRWFASKCVSQRLPRLPRWRLR